MSEGEDITQPNCTRKMLEHLSGGASMKGKKEGGEIKGREGRKRGKGEKERGKKRKGEREKKKQEFHSRDRTRDLPLCSQPPMAIAPGG